MKLRFLNHPVTGKPDALLTMSCVVVLICSLKFLLEGVELPILGHLISLGHADAMSYGAMLTPVLGAHGAGEYRRIANQPRPDTAMKADNPDAQ